MTMYLMLIRYRCLTELRRSVRVQLLSSGIDYVFMREDIRCREVIIGCESWGIRVYY